MATLGDLKTRIIADMDRADLAGESAAVLAAHITNACDYYAGERFWFNAGYASVTTAAGVETVALPA